MELMRSPQEKKARKPPGKPIVRGVSAPTKGKATKQAAKKGGKGGPYQRYDKLDWVALRSRWENTEVSTMAFCRWHGIKSDNTVRQRIVDEGWVKNIDAIAANLVQAGIAATAGDPLTPLFDLSTPRLVRSTVAHDAQIIEGEVLGGVCEISTPTPTPSIPPKGGMPSPAAPEPKKLRASPRALSGPGMPDIDQFAAFAGPVAAAAEDKRRDEDMKSAGSAKARKTKEFRYKEADGETSLRGRRPRVRISGDETAREGLKTPTAPPPLLAVPTADEAEAMSLRTAQDLATLHIRASAEQVLNADRLSLVSNVMLARIMVALGEDGVEAGEARGALMSLNPDKETFTGLLKVVADTMEKAAVIKRRALSMDPRATGAPPNAALLPAGVPRSESDLARLMKGMPPEVLQQLRGASAALARLPPGSLAPQPDPQPEEEVIP